MAEQMYNRGIYLLATAALNLSSETIKVMLIQPGYIFDPDHNFVSDITGGSPNYEVNEDASGTGYNAGFSGSGRKTLSGKTVTQNDTDDRTEFDHDDFLWPAIDAGIVLAAVYYKEGTSDADSELIMYTAPDDAINTGGGDLTIAPQANGVIWGIGS